MLTDKAVRAAAAKDKAYKLNDSGGLYLHVSPKGHKSWRFKYRFESKEQLLTIGSYPDVSLAVARQQRDDARKNLREGRDPRVQAKRGRLLGDIGGQKSLEVMAREWHKTQTPRWKPVHANDVITSLERDIFPVIGSMPMETIDQPLLLSVLRKIEKRGAIETARRINQRISAIYRFARAQGLKMENPSDGINDALAPLPPSKRYPALLNLSDIQTMIADIDIARASPITKLASRFLALTAQRPGMVRHLEWGELQNIDWGNPDADLTDARWCVLAAKMKQELRLRSDETFDHLVPLTRQAVETLCAVRWLTGTAKYVFPNARSGMEPASENAIGYLYNREGYRGRHVPHGWRSSFSTLMNEYAERTAGEDPRVLGDRKIIDLMLAHTPSGLSPSELRYNRASYMDRRRQLATLWADMIMEGAMPVEGFIDGPRR